VSQATLFEKASPLAAIVEDLRKDLLAEGGPQISSMGTYRFAILVYKPSQEFELRKHMRKLSDELAQEDWDVLAISLHRLFLDRLRAEDPDTLESLIAAERRLQSRNPERGLNHLKDRIARFVEGPDGIARDVAREIDQLADRNPGAPGKTLILLSRAGALYPFFRSSSLLKYIDGKTRGFPVVLLYPGRRQGPTALSFMDELPADSDYRPRIYS
jgi:hypothetical protein